MNAPRELPNELVWEGEHLSEVALTALADGQDDVLPRAACEHATTCVACMHALGGAALLSSQVGDALGALAAEAERASEAPVAARTAFPFKAVLGALGLALLGALPVLTDPELRAGAIASFFVRTLPQLLRGGVAVLRAFAEVAPAVSLVASCALVFAGFLIARAMPRTVAA